VFVTSLIQVNSQADFEKLQSHRSLKILQGDYGNINTVTVEDLEQGEVIRGEYLLDDQQQERMGYQLEVEKLIESLKGPNQKLPH
jgi:hypothetical protein